MPLSRAKKLDDQGAQRRRLSCHPTGYLFDLSIKHSPRVERCFTTMNYAMRPYTQRLDAQSTYRPLEDGSSVQLGQQFVGVPQVRNDNAATHDHRHVQRFFLLGARHAQPV